MPFDSPFSARRDLYTQSSTPHSKTHLSRQEREIELRRVLDLAFDPVTGKKLPNDRLPSNVLKSRRGQATYVEALCFIPTASELLAQMDFFLARFITIIKRYKISTEHYIVQMREAFHFSFGGTTSPNVGEKFFQQKRLEANSCSAFSRVDAVKELVYLSQQFLDNVQPSMILKEIKMNDDGHVVLRMNVEQEDDFFDFSTKWQRLFPNHYQRYVQAERKNNITLACVLGVVNIFSMTQSKRTIFKKELNDLLSEMTLAMKDKSYSFPCMAFIEASNRMLQRSNVIGRLSIRGGYVRLSERYINASDEDTRANGPGLGN